jgi:hypothetical protein
LPKKTTKHIPKPETDVGWVKDGKVKVLDKDSGKIKWRGGRSAMSLDWDGDPIARNYDKESLKAYEQDNRKSKKPKSSLGARKTLK